MATKTERKSVISALSKRKGDWLRLFSDQHITILADHGKIKAVPAHTTVFSESEDSSLSLWVLLKGSVQVRIRETNGKGKGTHVLLTTHMAGTTFGDTTFFSPGRNNPTSLITVTEAVFLRISQAAFSKICDKDLILKIKTISLPATAKAMACLKGEVFQMMSALELSKISEGASCLWFHGGEVIYQRGDSSAIHGPSALLIYMIDSGQVELWTDSPKEGRKLLQKHESPGAIFGEASALLGSERKETAVAASECRLYAFSKAAFDLVWEQRPDIRARMLRTSAVGGSEAARQSTPGTHRTSDGARPDPHGLPPLATVDDPASCGARDPQQRFLACIQDPAPLLTIADADAFVLEVRAPPPPPAWVRTRSPACRSAGVCKLRSDAAP
jgi:CRP-like cAMP-binding protein